MSAIPANWTWKDHYKGSTFTPKNIKFNFDITGAIITCQLRRSQGSSVIYEWKTGVNITVINLLTGEIVLNQIYKFNIPAGNYVFDVEYDHPALQNNQTHIKGTLRVIQDITIPI